MLSWEGNKLSQGGRRGEELESHPGASVLSCFHAVECLLCRDTWELWIPGKMDKIQGFKAPEGRGELKLSQQSFLGWCSGTHSGDAWAPGKGRPGSCVAREWVLCAFSPWLPRGLCASGEMWKRKSCKVIEWWEDAKQTLTLKKQRMVFGPYPNWGQNTQPGLDSAWDTGAPWIAPQDRLRHKRSLGHRKEFFPCDRPPGAWRSVAQGVAALLLGARTWVSGGWALWGSACQQLQVMGLGCQLWGNSRLCHAPGPASLWQRRGWNPGRCVCAERAWWREGALGSEGLDLKGFITGNDGSWRQEHFVRRRSVE